MCCCVVKLSIRVETKKENLSLLKNHLVLKKIMIAMVHKMKDAG
jgi:hypothetical protein